MDGGADSACSLHRPGAGAAPPRSPHSPRALVQGGRLQVLLDALVVLHLRGHRDGHGRAAPAAGGRASTPAGVRARRAEGVTGEPALGWASRAPRCRHPATGMARAPPLPPSVPRQLLAGTCRGTRCRRGAQASFCPPGLQALVTDGSHSHPPPEHFFPTRPCLLGHPRGAQCPTKPKRRQGF